MSDLLQRSTTRIHTPIGEMVIVADAQDHLRAAGYGGGLARKRWLLEHEKGRRASIGPPQGELASTGRN